MEKIVIVTGSIPPIFAGGGLRAYRYALRLYKKDKLSFILTEENVPIEERNFIFKKFEKLSSNKIITVTKEINKDKKRNQNKIKYFFPFVINQIKIFSVILWKIFQKRDSFTIIHCIGAGSWLSLYSVLISKFFCKKTILEITLLGQDDPISIGKNSNILIRSFRSWLFSKADIVISKSPSISEVYKISGIPIEKLREVPNPVDINKFYPINKNEKTNLRKKLGFKKDITIILSVGSIIKRKGIDLLIKSFKKYNNKYTNTILILVGPTNNNKKNLHFYNKMRKLTKDLNIEKRIVFTGIKDNVDEYMKISDIFVFLSKREGLPNAILESMSTGIPVIALNIPGITEYIIENRVNGIVLYEENPDKVALEIEKLLNNRDMYKSISVNARNTILNKFSTKIIDEQYERIYNEITQLD